MRARSIVAYSGKGTSVVTRAAATRPHARRRRGWRPRRSIANLLRLLVAVPLLAVVGFAGLTLLGNVRQVVDAGDTQRLAALATDAGALARALQAERAAAAVALTTTDEVAVERFDLEVAQTDSAIAAFERHGTPTEAVEITLRRVDTGMGEPAEHSRPGAVQRCCHAVLDLVQLPHPHRRPARTAGAVPPARRRRSSTTSGRRRRWRRPVSRSGNCRSSYSAASRRAS